MWWLRAAIRQGARSCTLSLPSLLHQQALPNTLAQLAVPSTRGGCTASTPLHIWQRTLTWTPAVWQDDPPAVPDAADKWAGMTPVERARAIAAAKKRRPPWFLRTPRRDPSEPMPPKPPKIDRYSRRKKPFRAPDTVVGVVKDARISPKKLNLIARLVRRMTARDAVLQCGISDKKAGRIAFNLLQETVQRAKQKGLDTDQLVVDKSFVNKGKTLKRVRLHAKGRSGRAKIRYSNMTVVLKESADEVAHQVMVLEPYAVRLANKLQAEQQSRQELSSLHT